MGIGPRLRYTLVRTLQRVRTTRRNALEIYVDADACPVKDEVVRVADRHRLVVHMVSNSYMRLPERDTVRRVVVGGDADEADDWIAERIGPGDIAITADIPLADRCLKAGAAVLGHNGKPFTDAGIGSALAMRDLMGHLRETGEIRGGGPSFAKRDRSRFLEALERMIQAERKRALLSRPKPPRPTAKGG